MKRILYIAALISILPILQGLSLEGTTGYSCEAQNNNLSSRDVVTTMLGAIGNTKTLQYTFKSYERLKSGKEFFTEMEMKVQLSPMKVYGLTKSDPNKGVELLYVTGMWDGKAYINPGNWLPNVRLSPFGGRMRENQHHTILDSGFGLLANIIKDAMKRADTERPGEFDTFCRIDGDVTWDGKQCYKLVIDDPTYTYLNYVVQEGDDVDKIAYRKNICGYLIIEKNSNVKDWDGLKTGTTIKIPSSYAKKTILYIDKQNYLPIVQIMYDEVGQFEKYEFHNLKVNPMLKDSEFTTDFEGYDF